MILRVALLIFSLVALQTQAIGPGYWEDLAKCTKKTFPTYVSRAQDRRSVCAQEARKSSLSDENMRNIKKCSTKSIVTNAIDSFVRCIKAKGYRDCFAIDIDSMLPSFLRDKSRGKRASLSELIGPLRGVVTCLRDDLNKCQRRNRCRKPLGDKKRLAEKQCFDKVRGEVMGNTAGMMEVYNCFQRNI